jgi:hypothetical protein
LYNMFPCHKGKRIYLSTGFPRSLTWDKYGINREY